MKLAFIAHASNHTCMRKTSYKCGLMEIALGNAVLRMLVKTHLQDRIR